MKIFRLIPLFLIVILLAGCGDAFKFRKVDATEFPPDPKLRVKKNMEEGRGFRLGSIGKSGGDFMFASSNPLWRATIDKLDFTPLGVVDYGGGVIITEWFSQDNNQDEIKIAVRFLSNEIRSDAIKVIIHTRRCQSFNECKISQIENSNNKEIKIAILKKAAELEQYDQAKKKEEIGDYKIPGKNF